VPKFRTFTDFALGYRARGESRSGPQYRVPSRTISYGSHPLQALDLHTTGNCERPIIVFVHGGAWQFGDKARRLQDMKIPFAHSEGWHFAALNFRMVPEVGLAGMAGDVAAGIASLMEQANTLGIDRKRIVLMGHSSGAHLAALVGTDPALLGRHGVALSDIAGVIANDGAAYDARQPSTGSPLLERRLVAPAFAGCDRAAFSPVVHASKAALRPPFLILHAARKYAVHQSRLLEQALRNSTVPAERHGFPGTGAFAHLQLSRQLGRPGFGPTEVTRKWLRKIGHAEI